MPSPIGHAVAGFTVHVLCARGQAELSSWSRIGAAVGAALAPDLDLLLRYVDGRNHHQAESHSIGFAVLAGLAVFLLARRLEWNRPHAVGFTAGAGWLSHVLLDYLARDTHPPIGIMALWPASPGYFKFPWPIFLDIGRTLDWSTIRHDAVAAAWELAVLLPLLMVAVRVRFPAKG